MASQLKVDTITGVTTAGSIAITGEGNSTTTNLQQGLAKAWIRYDGTSPGSGADSLNIASITDSGTGDQRPVMTNAMASENYAPVSTSAQYHELLGNAGGSTGTTTTTFKIETRNSSNSAADTGRVACAVLGDLA